MWFQKYNVSFCIYITKSDKFEITCTYVMNKSFNFCLHAPVFEFYFAEFISSHYFFIWVCFTSTRVLFPPIIVQWSPLRSFRLEYFRVFFSSIIAAGYVIFDDVNEVWNMCKIISSEICVNICKIAPSESCVKSLLLKYA